MAVKIDQTTVKADEIYENNEKLSDKYLELDGDSQNNTVTFTSDDSSAGTSWTDVAALSSKEKHSSILNKISTMFKNIRYLYMLLGTTDISTVGGGTVTGAISQINNNLITQINRFYIPDLNTATSNRHGIITPDTRNSPVLNIYGDLYYGGDLGYAPGTPGWATQMVITSDGHIYWRHAINEAGWSTWKRIDSAI